jgi:hypothetical protein
MSLALANRLTSAGVDYHVNVGFAYIGDVQAIEQEAIEKLLQNIKLIAPNGSDAVIDPLFPLTDIGTPTAPSKFVDAVAANNYRDDWTLTYRFTSPVSSFKGDAFAFRVKADAMVLAFGAVLLDQEAVNAIRHINIYKQMNKQRLVYTVDVSRAVSAEGLPYYFVPFGAVLLVKPSEEVAVELIFSEKYLTEKTAGASGTTPVDVTIKMQLLPSVKLIPKASSAYVQRH